METPRRGADLRGDKESHCLGRVSSVSVTFVIQVVAVVAVSVVALAAFAYGSSLGYRRGQEQARKDGLATHS
jgi:hypothetical protein